MDRHDFYELIQLENEKSKDILEEYEKNMKDLKTSYLKEAEEIDETIKSFKNKLLILQSETEETEDSESPDSETTETDDVYLDDEDIEEKIKITIKYLERKSYALKEQNPHPHGNGLFGFALAYAEAARNIGVEWVHPIWTWTILDYKRVYPRHSIDYLRYQEDIKTPDSEKIMKNIINDLRDEKRNPHEIFYGEWIDIINKYLTKKSITISDETVFRPPLHLSHSETRKDDVNFERITKSDLVETEGDCDEEFDLFDFIHNISFP